jgi:hypothetical protein
MTTIPTAVSPGPVAGGASARVPPRTRRPARPSRRPGAGAVRATGPVRVGAAARGIRSGTSPIGRVVRRPRPSVWAGCPDRVPVPGRGAAPGPAGPAVRRRPVGHRVVRARVGTAIRAAARRRPGAPGRGLPRVAAAETRPGRHRPVRPVPARAGARAVAADAAGDPVPVAPGGPRVTRAGVVVGPGPRPLVAARTTTSGVSPGAADAPTGTVQPWPIRSMSMP